MNYITTSIRAELLNVSSNKDTLIHRRLMRPQQSALRFAYNRLVEGVVEKEIWQILRQKFPLLTGRNLNDAIMQAKGILKSQRERLQEQVQTVTAQIERSEAGYQRALERGDKTHPERLQAIQRRIQRLMAKRDELKTHQRNGTVPPVIFGGRKLWQAVSRSLPDAQLEWREKRSGQFYSRGAKDAQGNPHCRLIIDDVGNLRLSVRVPDGLKKKGNKLTTSALWLTFDLSYSRQYEHLLRSAVLDGQAKIGSYDVRLMRLSPGQYRTYITVDEPVAHREYSSGEMLPEWCQVIGGVDLNLNHLAIVITDRQGQFRGHRTFKYDNLGELPRDKSKWLIGNIAADIIQHLKDNDAQALIIEDLKITQRSGGHPKFNRRTVPFTYRQLRDVLVRRALRNGLVVKAVNPAYTSWIGRLKYARPFGVSVHIAAAYVIARRGLGLQERIPEKLLRTFPALTAILEENIELLETGMTDGKDPKIANQLKTRREWLNRLENWKLYSPKAGRPWLLWVTLYLVNKNVSGVRAILN